MHLRSLPFRVFGPLSPALSSVHCGLGFAAPDARPFVEMHSAVVGRISLSPLGHPARPCDSHGYSATCTVAGGVADDTRGRAMTYTTFEVPVAGGSLTVGRWGRQSGRVVVALHGVTGTHADFHALADQLADDDLVLVAPDLRGRGGSNGLSGPFGMASHADDAAAVITHSSTGPVTVVGHSMGGFVALVLADRHPDLVEGLVLVDGGLPIDVGGLADGPVEDVVDALLGPSLGRLRMTFESPEAYLDFWRPHPALHADWNEYMERRVLYDLEGEAPDLRSTVREEAVVEDTKSDLFGDDVAKALANLRHPAVFLRAPRGQFDQEPPLYPAATVEKWCAGSSHLEATLVPDVNHFTILLTRRGATAVAEAVRRRRVSP